MCSVFCWFFPENQHFYVFRILFLFITHYFLPLFYIFPSFCVLFLFNCSRVKFYNTQRIDIVVLLNKYYSRTRNICLLIQVGIYFNSFTFLVYSHIRLWFFSLVFALTALTLILMCSIFISIIFINISEISLFLWFKVFNS